MTANAVCNARTHARRRACTRAHTHTSFVLHASHSFLSPTPQHFTGLMQVSCRNTEFSCEKHSQLLRSCGFVFSTLGSQLQEQGAAKQAELIPSKFCDFVLWKIPPRLELPHVWRGRLCQGHKSPDSICVCLSERRIWRAEAHVGRFPQFAYK